MDKAEIYDTLNRAYFSDECHEKDVITHLPLLLRDHSLVVDIGASLGQYTHAFSKAISNSEIWAIEADPIRVEQLAQNCNEWATASKNTIKALHLAVTSHTGKVPYFVTNSDVSGGLAPHETSRAVDWQEITVDSASLDELFVDRSPDLVKIDVEGAELSVLEGARRILGEGTADFLIEVHDWASDSSNSDRVVALMSRSGYRWVSFFGMPLFTRSTSRWGKLKLLEWRVRARHLLARFFTKA